MAIFQMPVFFLLTLLFIFFIWVLASALFKPAGRFLRFFFRDFQNNLSDSDPDKNTDQSKEIHL